MTPLEGWLADRRRGQKGAKLWVSWPVRIDAKILDRLYHAVHGRDRWVQVRRNGIPVEVSSPDRYSSFASQVRFGKYDDHVRSIELNGHVTVYLGPRTVYAFASSKDPKALAALWEVREILNAARRRPGTVLYRTWGAAVAFAVVIAVTFQSGIIAESARAGALIAMAGCALYVIAAIVEGVFRRILFRLDGEIERRAQIRNGLYGAGLLLSGILGAIIQALIS